MDATDDAAGQAARTARLLEKDGVLVAMSETQIDDDTVFDLIDAGRETEREFTAPQGSATIWGDLQGSVPEEFDDLPGDFTAYQ